MMTSDDKVGGWVKKGQNHDDVILECPLRQPLTKSSNCSNNSIQFQSVRHRKLLKCPQMLKTRIKTLYICLLYGHSAYYISYISSNSASLLPHSTYVVAYKTWKNMLKQLSFQHLTTNAIIHNGSIVLLIVLISYLYFYATRQFHDIFSTHFSIDFISKKHRNQGVILATL